MRYLGLDLGVKTLGVAISDKTNTLASPLTLIEFERENYDEAIDKLLKIIEEYKSETAKDVQEALKDIFGPIFEAMLQGEMNLSRI